MTIDPERIRKHLNVRSLTMADAGQDDERPFAPIELGGAQPVQGQATPSMIGEIEWFDDLTPSLTSQYIIKELLDRTAMSVIYGPSNSGKTFFALDLAYHVAIGRDWRGRRVNSGVVLYLAAEGGNGIANRIVALRQSDRSTDVPLALRRAGLDLLHPQADVQRVIDLAASLESRGKVVLIVIDTLSRVLAGGDENGPADMTAFVKNVDRIRLATNTHIMVVHHTGKDTAKGARGHSSLRAATDTEIEITLDEAGNRTATVQKQRDHRGGDAFGFALSDVEIGVDQDGDPVRTCIVVEAEASRARSLTVKQRTAMHALDDALEAHGERKTGNDWPPCKVVPVEHWRSEYYRRIVADTDNPDSRKKAFQRVREALQERGVIAFFDQHVWRVSDAA
ncbi:helicase RepA family protein [Jiella marina]|uniref:helicase RepA family protein n=1 Tax=Jiella sp. LLJ827 TaxID=2917712 RepID=UPI002100AF39|nr:helicase RepA family protein [Jiella sp. LLJ827]MCQ0986490.1 helicase RepA family protein [Jiella sp. LLJ827]